MYCRHRGWSRPNCFLVRSDHVFQARLHAAALVGGLLQPFLDRVARAELRDQEVDRRSRPHDADEKHQTPDEITQ